MSARFDPARHNARLLRKYRGDRPAGTLAMFERSVPATIAPTRDYAAFLGEVIVHGQDVARPLQLTLVPDPRAVLDVARFFVGKDFAVNSRATSTGLELHAEDADFTVGDGPVVRGRLLDLVMVMAGRPESLTGLAGDGVEELGRRIAPVQ